MAFAWDQRGAEALRNLAADDSSVLPKILDEVTKPPDYETGVPAIQPPEGPPQEPLRNSSGGRGDSAASEMRVLLSPRPPALASLAPLSSGLSHFAFHATDLRGSSWIRALSFAAWLNFCYGPSSPSRHQHSRPCKPGAAASASTHDTPNFTMLRTGSPADVGN